MYMSTMYHGHKYCFQNKTNFCYYCILTDDYQITNTKNRKPKMRKIIYYMNIAHTGTFTVNSLMIKFSHVIQRAKSP